MAKRKTIAVYLRVSTASQDTRSQKLELAEWLKKNAGTGQVVWYRDTFTGRTMNRPGMRKLEQDIAAGKIGQVLVWRIDRLGRTARELLAFLEELDGRGVEFLSLRDGIRGAGSATGRLLRTILAGFAEYEREVISERIRAGQEQARSDGKTWGGRKPGERTTLTPEKLRAIRNLLDDGMKKTAIARQLGISRASLYRAISILESSVVTQEARPRGAVKDYNEPVKQNASR